MIINYSILFFRLHLKMKYSVCIVFISIYTLANICYVYIHVSLSHAHITTNLLIMAVTLFPSRSVQLYIFRYPCIMSDENIWYLFKLTSLSFNNFWMQQILIANFITVINSHICMNNQVRKFIIFDNLWTLFS